MNRWRWIALIPIAAACSAQSEGEIQAEFDSFVEGANRCSVDSECVLLSPECPLPCWVSVNGESATDVSKKAEELVDEYESEGRSCANDCTPRGEPRCVEGRCAIAEASADGGT